MKTEIKKRTFEASKYPKGSIERIELNKNSLTSEYMVSHKYILFVHVDADEKYNAITYNYNFRTKSDAMDKEASILNNPNYYKI